MIGAVRGSLVFWHMCWLLRVFIGGAHVHACVRVLKGGGKREEGMSRTPIPPPAINNNSKVHRLPSASARRGHDPAGSAYDQVPLAQ